MSIATIAHRAADGISLSEIAPQALDGRADVPRALIVASKGDASSRSAARVARAVAGDMDEVRVLVVDDPQALDVLTSGKGADRAWLLESAVRMQLDGCGCRQWPVDVRRGDAATTICRAADDRAADMIVVGLSEHGMLDRALHRETTLRVLRNARTPVLAVVPWAIGRPRIIVAAIDFSPASVRAMRIASSLAAPGCRIILAHVLTPVVSRASRGVHAFSEIVAAGAEEALARLADGMPLPAHGIAQSTVLRGDRHREIAALAARVGADLVTLGARQGGATPSVILPSMRARLVRDATRSLLVAPGRARRINA